MNFLTGILAFILMLFVIVIIHEAGHYFAARACGVYVHEFSFGVGPKLWQKQGKNTLFSLRALPFGGSVSIAMDVDVDEDDEDQWLNQVPENQRLNNKPVWQQVFVMSAGVIINVLFAWLLMSSLIMVQGTVVDSPKPIVYEVIDNSPAAKAGLVSGDTILQIMAEDGSSVKPKTQDDVVEFLQYNTGANEYKILRGDETFSATMTAQYDEESQRYMLGFTSQSTIREVGFFESFVVGAKQLWNDTKMMGRSLLQLFQLKGLENLSGPVGVYKVTEQVVSYGFLSYLSLCSLISLNIGLFNLLPIPSLDGGRILITLFEAIFKRKIPQRFLEYLLLGSFALLIGLMIFTTYMDIVRFF
ncbi:M50 family metallopeptidase [Allobaculum stercoricanis]|uniref:M50 family metallopeptidase n=1 Tax=Allobaculum stercoricanis TaxID=174709 RepID=UPI00036D115B|nr:M50 family metallopeptidase [Allobaculum stercoricanis]